MSLRYVRVKDRQTKHEYDVLEHTVDPEQHQPLSKRRYPDVARPRAPKHFIGRSATDEEDTTPTETEPEAPAPHEGEPAA